MPQSYSSYINGIQRDNDLACLQTRRSMDLSDEPMGDCEPSENDKGEPCWMKCPFDSNK